MTSHAPNPSERNVKPIRFGVMCNGTTLRAWEAHCRHRRGRIRPLRGRPSHGIGRRRPHDCRRYEEKAHDIQPAGASSQGAASSGHHVRALAAKDLASTVRHLPSSNKRRYSCAVFKTPANHTFLSATRLPFQTLPVRAAPRQARIFRLSFPERVDMCPPLDVPTVSLPYASTGGRTNGEMGNRND